jgi:Tfp pilus assembly protein PilF
MLACLGCGGGRERPPDVPEEVARHNNLGTSLLSQQKWEDAAVEFQRAIEARPGDPIPLNNLAVARLQQGRIEDAERALRQALVFDPDHPHTHFNLGLIERNRGNFEAALTHFQKVAARDPEEVFTQYSLGSCLARLGRDDEAERALRRAIELHPGHISSLYALGRLLLQLGRTEEGSELITRSQEIRTRSGLEEAVGTQYGEQGPYAIGVDYPAGALRAPAPIPVTFRARGAATDAGERAATAWTVYVPDPRGAPALLAGGRGLYRIGLAGGTAALPDDAEIAGLVTADIDRNGSLEVVALTARLSVRVLEMGADGGLAWRESPLLGIPGAREPAGSAALALVDRDHDGDLDLFLCWGFEPSPGAPGCALATNDGSGRFSLDPPGHGVRLDGVDGAPVALAFSDCDNDRDVDLLVAARRSLRLFSNQRDGTFDDVSEARGLGKAVQDAGSLTVADLNKDGWMDLLVGDPDGPRILFNRRGAFEPARPVDAPAPPSAAGATMRGPGRALALDFDNDGFLDIAAVDAGGHLMLYRNLGAGEWGRGGAAVEPEAARPSAPLAALDADADGDQDLAVLGPRGLEVLANEGGNANRWLAIQPRGVGDNSYGVGAKVEVLAGTLRQKFEVTSPVPLHVGLGRNDEADAVRVLWPGGVLQDELHRRSGVIASLEQLDRKGTSCPLLYAWRDGAWNFVTDFLGGCAIGYQLAPGVFNLPDTDEYVKVDGGLGAEGGILRLRLNNQLEEVIWFDQAELVVVDHPEGTEVFPNERLTPGPPWPEFRLFASADVRAVAAARDVEGNRDVTELLRERDRRYVQGFGLLPFKGYAQPHTLELNLGQLPAGRRAVLLLDGWIDYADSTANIAAAQAGLRLRPPRLLVPDGMGDWREAKGLMGFPAGLPKTMAVELTGWLARADPRVRIETSMRIYWDSARLMVGGEDTPLRIRRLRPVQAELRFGGFPRETSPDGRKPLVYDPAEVSPHAGWKAHVGAYTPFGEVGALLEEIDDRFVTTRSGDEIELRFADPGPPVPGMTQTYLLYADGFGKDMDPNSAASDEVGPIPFHAMPAYPYGPEVKVPTRAASPRGGSPPRLVLAAPDGAPGATPLILVPYRPSSHAASVK